MYDEILGESINDSSIIRKGFTFLTYDDTMGTIMHEGSGVNVISAKTNVQVKLSRAIKQRRALLRGSYDIDGINDGRTGLKALGLKHVRDLMPAMYPDLHSILPVKIINECYGSTKNLNIPIVFASEFCLMKMNGVSAKTLHVFLEKLRNKSDEMHLPDRRMTKW